MCNFPINFFLTEKVNFNTNNNQFNYTITRTMEYTNLGTSGLKISKIVVGCMSFGSKSWSPWAIEDEEKAFSILKKAYDLGIRTFDTADTYSNGQSEIILGKFLKKFDIKRSTVVILTKVFFLCDLDKNPNQIELLNLFQKGQLDEKYLNQYGLSRKHIVDAVDESVERLGTYIDVLQIHRFDPSTPKEETMKALHDVVQSGKVRYIGASSMWTYQFAQLQFIAEKNRWTKFISMQNLYNLVDREEEREMIPFCKDTGVGIIPWSPLGGGILARPVSEKSSTERGGGELTAMFYGNKSKPRDTIIDRVEEISKKRNVPMSQIALAWVIYKGASPIVGFNKESRVDDAVAALKIKLTDEEIKYLEEPYVPQPQKGFS